MGFWRAGLALLVLTLVACGSGGGGRDNQDFARGSNAGTNCSGFCADTPTSLATADVEQIVAQAVAQANALGISATIAVVDRVGNVLAVFRMNNVTTDTSAVTVQSAAGIDGGLEQLRLPVSATLGSDAVAAIAKAITGAYLSSEGNGFSTRVASQIVQEHFNPGEDNQPAGPLFGVQFSQLPCSDFVGRNPDALATNDLIGPKRSPLGLSADPGGFPLYKNGTPVGGIGVIGGDFLYSADLSITDVDSDNDELIALAGTFGFAVPADRQADRITVDGKTLRFSDSRFDAVAAAARSAGPGLPLADGALISVRDYYDAADGALPGTAFGTPASGVRSDSDTTYPGRDAFVFVDAANADRHPPVAGSNLTAAEVRDLIDTALSVANRARAQIRRPLGSAARVTISVVDTDGSILGMARTRDAPVFGADVSLQKARTAAFFSSTDAASFITALPDTQYLNPNLTPSRTIVMSDYVNDLRAFFGDNTALANGIAFSDRAGGNLSRPFYPDGIDGAPNGPLSKPQGEWSPFSTGFQLDADMNAIISHVSFLLSGGTDVGQNCVGVPSGSSASIAAPRIANGVQIFPGSVPIYRGNTLVGAIGVSGDGVDQDDMIAFLAVHEVGEQPGATVNNAPTNIRADTLSPQGVRLRYISCPQAPFNDSDEQAPCNDK